MKTHTAARIALALLFVAEVARADGTPTAPSRAASTRAWVEAILHTMEGNTSRVRDVLHAARVSHDAKRAACASSVLSRADAAVRRGRDESVLLLAAKDDDELSWRMGVLAEIAIDQREALRSGDRCMWGGAERQATAEQTIVTVTVDPSIPPK